MPRIAVTLTTINLPTVLGDFEADIKSGTEDIASPDFIVVGDSKTPSGTREFIENLDKQSTSNFVYFDLEDQKKLFSKFTSLYQHIPVGSFARRNFADLFAYQEGYDTVIRIDDDNYPMGDNFIEAHGIVGEKRVLKTVEASNGWYNVCETLEERHNIAVYPRGMPYEIRWQDQLTTVENLNRKVVVNAGLWLGDPDVDAITRLCRPVHATEFKDGLFGSQFALASGTWCPINTQNTSYARETIPAAFISPFAGRYDDILSGYFLRRIIDHFDHAVTYGRPLLNQVRNEHNLWSDLDKEKIGGETSLHLTDFLRLVDLQGDSYAACLKQITLAVEENFPLRTEFYGPILAGMKIWADLFLELDV